MNPERVNPRIAQARPKSTIPEEISIAESSIPEEVAKHIQF
jgi:hypothetical protein